MPTTDFPGSNPDETVVLVTGFGPFLNIKTNPSAQIVSLLPTNFTHRGASVRIVTLPALKVSYHEVATTISKVLDEVSPDIVIHIGLAVEREYFAIEKGADRYGYDGIPDDVRKVWTKRENKEFWGKSPERLDSGFDFEELLELWKGFVGEEGGKGKGGGKGQGNGKGFGKGKGTSAGKPEDLRISDDVGSYICGFIYYLTLERFWKLKKESNVVFLHVPSLIEGEGIDGGVNAVIGLIKALVVQGVR